ncbi:hypothetical protein [Phytohabitans suffuscus]|uniref:FXSXX-COOH protein n=1 Tax=Phytohabitans suffuscus TaxID=624315 RepID=A0A6F8YXW8_9ACTN|nr:hypothetical protein [Phytohabitans suffuscus]BCB90919.1 hypothetical protein Psuf_082320 [Phytohabitans suffuscus]
MDEAQSRVWHEMQPPAIDVTQSSIRSVLLEEDTTLANAVRRLLDDIAVPGESYAAHSSTP